MVLRAQIKRMIKELKATGIRKILQIELAVRPDGDQRGMTASGMIVINPPWKLEQQMNNVLPWLHSKLVPAGTGHTTVKLDRAGVIAAIGGTFYASRYNRGNQRLRTYGMSKHYDYLAIGGGRRYRLD